MHTNICVCLGMLERGTKFRRRDSTMVPACPFLLVAAVASFQEGEISSSTKKQMATWLASASGPYIVQVHSASTI